MNQEIRDWLDYAKMDLNGAKLLNSADFPRPIQLVCYHCQQSAEKAVKALLIQHGCSIPRTHDIVFLLENIRNNVVIDDKLYKHASYLTKYGVETRYPNELDLTEKDADAALEYATEIYKWVESMIEK